MYEVAQVAGNKVEAACALQSLSNIMGQITSNHHQHGKNIRAAKVYPRHSTNAGGSIASSAMRDDKLYGERIKDLYTLRDSTRNKNLVITNNAPRQSDRPVTISQMNAYNVEKSSNSNAKNNKEFYTVGEGYHKTESCYYKTADGRYHKLPPDSYHKMSEICYTKLPDGSFCRLDGLNNTINNDSNTSNHKVRDQMIRFLKRSKSHTPATIKEVQKNREKELERFNASGNRKVVVTMMENGGLPIVATSKPNKPIVSKEKANANKDIRNNITKVFICFFINIITTLLR